MQSFVDSLAKQRKHHIDKIANTTMQDLKEMVIYGFELATVIPESFL